MKKRKHNNDVGKLQQQSAMMHKMKLQNFYISIYKRLASYIFLVHSDIVMYVCNDR